MEIVIYCAIFVPMLCAPAAYLLGRRRGFNGESRILSVAAPAFVMMCLLPLLLLKLFSVGDTASTVASLPVCGFGLNFRADGLRCLLAFAASFAWLWTAVSGLEYYDRGGYKNVGRLNCFSLLTLGAVVGVFLSCDFLTLFVFFEIMSFSSYPMVAHDETSGALRAAATYLGISILGGMASLMGMALLYSHAGTLDFDSLHELFTYFEPDGTVFAACVLMLAGFGAKAGIIGLHVWLPKAHPVAPAPMSALLSGVLTKTGIFGLLCVTSFVLLKSEKWSVLLLVLGLATALWGAFSALLSSNIKKVLACSSMSQLGFIIIGIALIAAPSSDTYLAASGTVYHMINHTLLKLLLFTCAGVIYQNTHELRLSKLHGIGRGKLTLNLAFLCGALGISGFPFMNGYASKTLLHASLGVMAEASGGVWSAAEPLFTIAGGLTFAYMAKLYITLFVMKPNENTAAVSLGGHKSYIGAANTVVLTVSSAVILALGFVPTLILKLINVCSEFFNVTSSEFEFFTASRLLGALTSLGIGTAVLLLVVLPLIRDKNRIPGWFDLENTLYRPVLRVLFAFSAFISRVMTQLVDMFVYFMRKYLLTDLYSGKSLRTLDFEKRLQSGQFSEVATSRVSYMLRLHAAADHLIAQTFSFGLIVACMGIVAAVLYIVLQFYV